MNKFNDSAADSLAAVSGISAVAHFATEIQPIISASAGIVAIVSGLLASIYYIVKIWQRLKHQ
jgi:hypothetical protein